jgi:dTDP-4-dehydrorhamnose 3,5-epimerase
MPYTVIPTAIPDVLILEPKVFGDARGFFFESYSEQDFKTATGLDVKFVQDNHSRSSKGVLRGLHYQLPPHAQGKLVRCVRGAVFDVAVDIRQSSPTCGKWVGVELSEHNHHQFWIPPGFAHGFVTLTDTADFLYKTTAYYSPMHERGLSWCDPVVGVSWPDVTKPFSLSEKDKLAPFWKDAELASD